MIKLTLDLDALAVQSFETTPAQGGRGTVLGNADPIAGAFEPQVGVVKTNDSMAPGCTTVWTGCGEGLVAVGVYPVAPEPVVGAEPVRAVDTAHPGCTTVHAGCSETAA